MLVINPVKPSNLDIYAVSINKRIVPWFDSLLLMIFLALIKPYFYRLFPEKNIFKLYTEMSKEMGGDV